MPKSKFYFAPRVRVLEVPVTDADPDAVVLFDMPKGILLGISAQVDDAFNTSAKLNIGIPGDADYLVAAQAIDATGLFACTLAHYLHDSTKTTPITATVSDKTATGKVRLIVLFAVDKETKFQ